MIIINDRKESSVTVGNTYYFKGEIPIKCPHCSHYIEPHPLKVSAADYDSGFKLFTIVFKGNCCSNLFFANYRVKSSTKTGDLLCVYPPTKAKPLPDAINEISPRFIELYNQAFFAERNNYFELAGSGYRNALEVLIKDYAINILEKPGAEVAKKKLYDAIGTYMPDISLSTAADVVRVLGNDFTHYERRYSDVDLSVLKRYLHIFINSIENEYLIKNPIVNTNRS